MAGVCGKTAEVAALQDLLVHAVKGLSLYAGQARRQGIVAEEADAFTLKALFSTVTNVDFDPERFESLIRRAVELREHLKDKLAPVTFADPAAAFRPAADLTGLIRQGEKEDLIIDPGADPDIQSLQRILVYGLKGVGAYAEHALILGQKDDRVFTFIHDGLSALSDRKLNLDDWVKLVLQCGEVNLRALELLDAGNTGAFGHPVPTRVPLGHRKGKCILVSGHDPKDLSDLLDQTEGKGIDVYTHGEMLPAHGWTSYTERFRLRILTT